MKIELVFTECADNAWHIYIYVYVYMYMYVYVGVCVYIYMYICLLYKNEHTSFI